MTPLFLSHAVYAVPGFMEILVYMKFFNKLLSEGSFRNNSYRPFKLKIHVQSDTCMRTVNK